MLQWIRKHRKALAGISVGAGAFFAAISFITYKVMAAEETTASGNNLINIGISTSDGNDMASVLQMLLVLTVISLAPSILIMLTSFTRIVIVLHFTRAALGTQTVPPNQVIIGLSLFLTFFVMSPVFTEVYDSALKPLSNNEISVEEAYETGVKPLKSFMLKQTSTKDLDTFFKIAGYEEGSVTSEDDISMTVLVPSFIISELRIVEGATVIAGGNITFNRGIQGMTRAVVKAGGNIVSKFIESAENVSAGGSIEADSILHSKVTAKSTIKASGRNGLIIGGDVKAVNMIEAKTIGNAMGTNTSVGVGVDPSMKRRVDELKNSLGKLGDNKIQLNQLLNALRKKQDSEGGLDEAKHELQMKTMRNVIMLEQEINKQKKELEELRGQIGEEKHACIKVSDAAYAGVKLTFGDQCMFLKQKYDYCQFVKEGADIKSAPI